MYFNYEQSLVYIPLSEGTPFMEGETISNNTVLNKYCDIEGEYFVYSFYVYPDPHFSDMENIPKEKDWV